ncbi:hypothetical protein [Paraburkholderia sp. SIMBA_054]|uniref:hypothetical protein n=1 Tax=Paraburkholderia sp. SIMBA_054 TaxID=3085795 RepID=UPI0039786B01
MSNRSETYGAGSPDIAPGEYVDPRVAEGSARRALEYDFMRPATAQSLERRAQADMLPTLLRMGNGLSAREFRRFVEQKALPRMARHGMHARVISDGGILQVRLLSVLGDPVEGIRVSEMIAASSIPVPQSLTVAVIRPHALARCMQRSGEQDHRNVKGELLGAAVLASFLAPVAAREQWQQVALPAGRGVFVGRVDDAGLFTLATFIRPGQNGRATRWDAFLHAIGPVPDPSKTTSRKQMDNWCEALVARLSAAGPISVRFPVLRQPYMPRRDALDERWAARERTARTERDGELVTSAFSE